MMLISYLATHGSTITFFVVQVLRIENKLTVIRKFLSVINSCRLYPTSIVFFKFFFQIIKFASRIVLAESIRQITQKSFTVPMPTNAITTQWRMLGRIILNEWLLYSNSARNRFGIKNRQKTDVLTLLKFRTFKISVYMIWYFVHIVDSESSRPGASISICRSARFS